MKDTGGPDHIIVRVRLPSGTIQTPVSKDDLYTTPPGKSEDCFHQKKYFSYSLCTILGFHWGILQLI